LAGAAFEIRFTRAGDDRVDQVALAAAHREDVEAVDLVLVPARQVPLAAVDRLVARLAEPLAHVRPAGVNRSVVADHAGLDGHAPGEQRAAGRRADGVRAVRLEERDAAGGEAVDVRRVHVRAAVGGEGVQPQLVADQEQEVGAATRVHRGGGKRPSGTSGQARHPRPGAGGARLEEPAPSRPARRARPLRVAIAFHGYWSSSYGGDRLAARRASRPFVTTAETSRPRTPPARKRRTAGAPGRRPSRSTARCPLQAGRRHGAGRAARPSARRPTFGTRAPDAA